MEIKNVKIADLKFATYNPRRITPKELKDLEKSIKNFGFVEPVVVNKDNVIIGGHQRVTVAESLKMEEVPCFYVDLPEDEAKALNIALNKIEGEWDFDKLQEMIVDLPENLQTLTGFSKKELEKLTNLFADQDTDMEDDFSDFDKENKNYEFRILIPKQYSGYEAVKESIQAIKEGFPEIIIKETL